MARWLYTVKSKNQIFARDLWAGSHAEVLIDTEYDKDWCMWKFVDKLFSIWIMMVVAACSEPIQNFSFEESVYFQKY